MTDEELSVSLLKTDSGRDMYVIIQSYFFRMAEASPFDGSKRPIISLTGILSLAGRNADKIKSVPRIPACMKM